MKRHHTVAAQLGLLGLCAVVALVVVFPNEANAVPSFARKYSMPCSACHAAWPMLNDVGRTFKENGFRLSRDEEGQNVISDFLELGERFPISSVVKARPYDKKESGDSKVRALHEVELMVAGSIHPNVPLFFEFEAEDEESFEFEFGEGYLGYYPSEFDYLNLLLSYAPVFSADPYDTLSSRRLTRGRNSVIDQRFGGADNNGRLRDSRQRVGINGRPVEWAFYSLGYSGVAGDAEGVNASNFDGRLAIDVIPELTLGAFGVTGECVNTTSNCSVDRDFYRIGVDAQADFQNVRLRGAYVRAQDDPDNFGPQEDNNAWYVEGNYFWREDDRPLLVPSVRFDHYEQSDGRDDFNEITLNLTYYLYENVKIFLEYFNQLDVPSGQETDSRVTLQVEAGF